MKWNDYTKEKPTHSESYSKYKRILVSTDIPPEPAWLDQSGKIIDAEDFDITDKVRYWADWEEIPPPTSS